MRTSRIYLLVGGVTVIAFGLWTARAWPSRRLPVAMPLVVSTAYVMKADTVRRNETLSHVFERQNLSRIEILELVRVAERDGLNPRRIRPGQVFGFRYAADEPKPDRVIVRIADESILTVVRDSAGQWVGSAEKIEWTVQLEHAEGEIRSSLYETLEALIPDSVLTRAERDRLIDDLADGVYGWVIDFRRDIYPGDGVRILFERLTSNLNDTKHGRIVAANVESRGVEHSAYVMTGEDGRDLYYDAEGRSMRRGFKLSPVSYRRISGRFTNNRFHPILKRNRPHLGMDFAANRGTPVTPTKEGTVTRAGRWGGYGIMVSIRHVNGIETRYAHLRGLARGIRVGKWVTTDDVIGYVGSTGLANGPHLHYEYLKNGRQRDPRKEQRASGDPVPEDRHAEFEALKARYDRLLASRSMALASNEID